MDQFHYRDGQLFCEDTPIARLAEEYGTPLYIYSQGMFLDTLKTLQ
jgi:diaminopimelate decarboxylase